MKHVIIGNGPAGLVAAETLRHLQPDAEIALIGDESEPPYSRMAIPYFLIGKIADSGTHLRKAHDHYARERIHLIERSKDRKYHVPVVYRIGNRLREGLAKRVEQLLVLRH